MCKVCIFCSRRFRVCVKANAKILDVLCDERIWSPGVARSGCVCVFCVLEEFFDRE
jgi:hypothetical protein